MTRLTPDQVKVGFIGLGNMGNQIAQRLFGHGWQLSVYDMHPAKAEAIAHTAVSSRGTFVTWHGRPKCSSHA